MIDYTILSGNDNKIHYNICIIHAIHHHVLLIYKSETSLAFIHELNDLGQFIHLTKCCLFRPRPLVFSIFSIFQTRPSFFVSSAESTTGCLFPASHMAFLFATISSGKHIYSITPGCQDDGRLPDYPIPAKKDC